MFLQITFAAADEELWGVTVQNDPSRGTWRCLKEFWYNRAWNVAGCPSFPKITKIGGS